MRARVRKHSREWICECMYVFVAITSGVLECWSDGGAKVSREKWHLTVACN